MNTMQSWKVPNVVTWRRLQWRRFQAMWLEKPSVTEERTNRKEELSPHAGYRANKEVNEDKGLLTLRNS